MDKAFKEELNQLDLETELYWRQTDELTQHIDWDKVQYENKFNFAEMLNGELGEDIKKVTSGELKVKLPWKLKFKYWIERIFKMF